MNTDDYVYEGSTDWLETSYEDRDGNPVVPSSVTYRVDCATTGKNMRGVASATPGSTVSIELEPSDNAINGQKNPYEIRVVTVMAEMDDGSVVNRAFEYKLINLRFV